MPPIDCANAPTPRVVAPYASTLRDAAKAVGVSDQAVADCGIPTSGEADVPVGQYLALLTMATQVYGPHFGCYLGQQVKPTTYGVNGILLLACPTLGEALQQVLRFEALVHDLGRSSLTLQGDRVIYRWRNDWPQHPAAAVLVESVFAGIKTCAEWLAGLALGEFAITFTHAPPAECHHWGEIPVQYHTAENSIVFPAALLALPIPQANNSLLPLLAGHAEQLLRERHQRVPAIVAQVRDVITAKLGSGPIQLGEVASALLLSNRTLQRRLSEAGQSFQMVLDTTRHELARHYLATSAMQIGEIGYLLGFQDPAAFHHAFKGWQGEVPSRFREQAQGKPISKTTL